MFLAVPGVMQQELGLVALVMYRAAARTVWGLWTHGGIPCHKALRHKCLVFHSHTPQLKNLNVAWLRLTSPLQPLHTKCIFLTPSLAP